jgi:DNA-binding MarR family transcriptional regulator
MERSASFKGIWIPRDILELPDLNLRQVVILSDIASLSRNGKQFFKSNETIARECRSSPATVKRDLNHLEKLDLIARAHHDGVRFIRTTSRLNAKTTEDHDVMNEGQFDADTGSLGATSNTSINTVMSTYQREQLDGSRFNEFYKNEDLQTAMNAWIEHLKQRGKPMTRNSINQTWLSLFEKSEESTVTAIQTIQHSISQNWKSLHPAPAGNLRSKGIKLDREKTLEWASR